MLSTSPKIGPSYLTVVSDQQLTDAVPQHTGWRRDLLQRCRRFATRAQLAAFTDAQIGELEQRGLIVSDATVLANCTSISSRAVPEPIKDLGILTCASPTMLTRSIHSWIDMLRRHQRTVRLTIVDDSGTAAEAHAQRETARSLADATGADLRFAGPDERRAIANEIAALAKLEPRLVQFAFDGRQAPRNGIGGSRNLLALLLQGRRVMCADDDIVAEFTAPQAAELDLWITAGDARMELVPFDTPEETRAAIPLSNCENPLLVHERFVGQTAANLICETEGHGSLFDASAELTQGLTTRDMMVAVTASGLAGDCGSDGQAFFTLLGTSPEAQKYILERGDQLNSSREILRKAKFPILCNSNSLMTFCCALDNSLPLPPFFPVGRGEDQAWQMLLHHVLPNTLIAHLPIAAAHRPAQRRAYSVSDYMDPCRVFPANAFIIWAIGKFAAEVPGESGIEAIGAHFTAVAADPAGFAANVGEAWTGYVGHHLQLVSQSLAMAHSAPSWWRRRLSEIRDGLSARLASGKPAPLEYASLSDAAALAAFRDDFGRYGELLQVWTRIRQAAEPLSRRLTEDPGWLRP